MASKLHYFDIHDHTFLFIHSILHSLLPLALFRPRHMRQNLQPAQLAQQARLQPQPLLNPSQRDSRVAHPDRINQRAHVDEPPALEPTPLHGVQLGLSQLLQPPPRVERGERGVAGRGREAGSQRSGRPVGLEGARRRRPMFARGARGGREGRVGLYHAHLV